MKGKRTVLGPPAKKGGTSQKRPADLGRTHRFLAASKGWDRLPRPYPTQGKKGWMGDFRKRRMAMPIEGPVTTPAVTWRSGGATESSQKETEHGKRKRPDFRQEGKGKDRPGKSGSFFSYPRSHGRRQHHQSTPIGKRQISYPAT